MTIIKPGDVMNEFGDICTLVPPRSDGGELAFASMQSGDVLVTREQAAAAEPYGWTVVCRHISESGVLVQITRGGRPTIRSVGRQVRNVRLFYLAGVLSVAWVLFSGVHHVAQLFADAPLPPLIATTCQRPPIGGANSKGSPLWSARRVPNGYKAEAESGR